MPSPETTSKQCSRKKRNGDDRERLQRNGLEIAEYLEIADLELVDHSMPLCGSAPAPSLLLATAQSGAGHALAQAAVLKKRLFELPDLLVKQVVGLVNQADQDVGHNLRRAGVREFTEGAEDRIMGRMGRR